MALTTRPATDAEIISMIGWDIIHARKISYRGFMRERSMRTAKNGVQHIQRFRAYAFSENGVPHIQTSRGVEKLAATVYIFDSGRECIADLRIKSEYLK